MPAFADQADVRFTLTGTGTSVGVPIIGCACPVCRSPHPRNQRLRTGVHVRTPQTEFVIDTSPELRLQLLTVEAQKVTAALFTHSHADHLMGLDDLRIFGFRMDAPVHLYCEPLVEQQIRATFPYAFADPATLANPFSAPRLEFTTIHPGDQLEISGLHVTPIRLLHGNLPILGFRFGRLAFCTDVSEIPDESKALLRGLDLLIIDALQHKPHKTHLTVRQAVELIDELQPRRALLTHMSHSLEYEALSRTLPSHIQPAFDGLEIRCRPDEDGQLRVTDYSPADTFPTSPE